MTTYVSSGIAWAANAINDALFRLRASSLHAAFTGAGLTQTADTGQINFTTVTCPGTTNTDAGYAIYAFADAAQGTDPIYLKIVYGTGASGGSCQYKVQLGQGTNGAGTLTGTLSTQLVCANGSASNAETVQHYACHTAGYFVMFGGLGNSSQGGRPMSFFMVARTRDDTGALDGLGGLICYESAPTALPSFQFVRWLNNAFVGAVTAHFCIVPGIPASTSLISGDKQLYPHFYADPSVRPSWSSSTVRGSEFGTSPTTFACTPIAALGSRTFIFIGSGLAPYGESGSNTAFQMAFLWE